MGYVQGALSTVRAALRGIWRALIYLPPVWVLVLNSLLFVQVQPAFGHSDAIVNCHKNIKYSKAVKVGVDTVHVTTKLYAEHYDTNGDGNVDVVALSQIDFKYKDFHKPNPTFWLVDTDFDNEPDKIYIDKFGKGKCEDIVLYKDLTAPTSNFDLPDDQDKGRDL